MHHKRILIFAITLFCTGIYGLHAQTVKDSDGNVYLAINIGKQVWMAENLKTTKFNDGVPIPLVTDDKAWEASIKPAYCWYNNDIENKDIYGALYNFFTVDTKKLCPGGWHVPTNTEWATMIIFLGDENTAADKLKESGLKHWKEYVTNPTNEFDFTALPGGLRLFSGAFPLFGNSYAVWWSSTEYNTKKAWTHGLHDSSTKVFKGYDDKQNGFSVRCIRD